MDLIFPLDSNILHHRLIRGGETNRPPSVILSAAKDLTRWVTGSFAQDDKQALSLAAAFWPPFLGLLNE